MTHNHTPCTQYNMDENTDEEEVVAEMADIAHDQSTGQDGDDEDAEQVKSNCLKSFACVDYIMEPGVSNQLQRLISK